MVQAYSQWFERGFLSTDLSVSSSELLWTSTNNNYISFHKLLNQTIPLQVQTLIPFLSVVQAQTQITLRDGVRWCTARAVSVFSSFASFSTAWDSPKISYGGIGRLHFTLILMFGTYALYLLLYCYLDHVSEQNLILMNSNLT